MLNLILYIIAFVVLVFSLIKIITLFGEDLVEKDKKDTKK